MKTTDKRKELLEFYSDNESHQEFIRKFNDAEVEFYFDHYTKYQKFQGNKDNGEKQLEEVEDLQYYNKTYIDWCYLLKAYNASYVKPNKRHNFTSMTNEGLTKPNDAGTRYNLTKKGKTYIEMVKEKYPDAWMYITWLWRG